MPDAKPWAFLSIKENSKWPPLFQSTYECWATVCYMGCQEIEILWKSVQLKKIHLILLISHQIFDKLTIHIDFKRSAWRFYKGLTSKICGFHHISLPWPWRRKSITLYFTIFAATHIWIAWATSKMFWTSGFSRSFTPDYTPPKKWIYYEFSFHNWIS